MRIYRHWRDLPAEARGASVALGNFDGVHLGHAALLRAAHAARPDAPRAVLTFSPHPRSFFRPEDPPFRLTDDDGRAAALAALGVSILYQLHFDAEFAAMPADSFINEVLVAGIGAVHLASGPDFAFGRRRGGSTALLAERAEALGVGFTAVPKLADESGPVSSSRIRRDLQDGYPERAAALLGRPWSVGGVVAEGLRLGRTIGFPTANISLGELIEPARGVYAVAVKLPDGRILPGVANLGRRPTVTDTLESRLEAHIFDFSGNLYGSQISVMLLEFLRAEQKFASLEALRSQIAADAAQARALFAGPLLGRIRLDHMAGGSA
jgi:riboflavin kinase / FMN adenylyltransferase